MNLIDLYASPSTADGTADVGNGDIQGVNADVSEAQQSQVDSEYTARKRASIRAQIDVLKQKKANLEAQNVELHSGMKDIPDEEVLRIGEQLGVPDVAESWLGARTARRNRIDAVAESQKTRSSIDKENALADSEQKNAAVTQLNELAESWATEANDYGKKAKRVSLEKAIENFNRRYPQDAIDAEKFEADYGGTARISGSAAPSAQGVPSGFDIPERPAGLSNEQNAEWDRIEHSALLSDHRGETDKRDADVAELKKIIAKRKDASDASATERSRMISDKVKAIKENEMQAKDTAHPGRAARAKNDLNGFYSNGKMVPGLYDAVQDTYGGRLMATKTTVIPREEARRILDGFATMGDDELYTEMYKYGFSDPGDFEDALKKSLSLSSPENAKASAQSAANLNSDTEAERRRAQAKADAEALGENKLTAEDVMKAYGLENGIKEGAILPFIPTDEEKAGIRAGGQKAAAAREQFGRDQRARFAKMYLDWDNPRDRELVSNAQQTEGIKRAAEDAFNGRGLGERAAMQASSFLFPRATQRAQAIAINPDARMPEGNAFSTLGADALKDVAEDAAMGYVGAAPAAAAAKGLAYPFARRLAVGAAIPVTANVADYVSYEGDPAMQDRAGFDLNSVIEQSVGNMIPISMAGSKGTRVLKKIQRAGNIDGMVTATRDIYDKNEAIAILQRGRQKADAAMNKVTSPAVRKDRMNQLLTNDPEVKAFFDNLPAKEQAKINAGQKFSSGKINDAVKQIQDEIRASGNLQMYKETAKNAGTKNINPVPPSMISAAIDRGVVPASRTGRRIEEAGLKFSPITSYLGDATGPFYPAVTNKFVRRYSGVDPVIDGGVLPSSKEKADAEARKKENSMLYYISRE